MFSATSVARSRIRFIDHDCHAWIATQAPCRWLKNVDLRFSEVPLSLLEDSGSPRDPAVVAKWSLRMQHGRGVPSLIVCKTSHGTYCVQDGNHRLSALRDFYSDKTEANVRVACVVPHNGFEFHYHRFGAYGTYVLQRVAWVEPQGEFREPVPDQLSPLAGRTLVLVAHPDDETGGCAGLLQRIREPMVFFATEGAPAGEWFWGRFGSQQAYSRIRRYEAVSALSEIGVKTVGFLGDWIEDGADLKDQELFKHLPKAFTAAAYVLNRLSPDVVLVPAYEGGHPDHDVCSFLGNLLNKVLHVDVWEMPLYHRSMNGSLVCRRFRNQSGEETSLVMSLAEVKRRKQMMKHYISQWDLPDYITTPIEYFRPQVAYDYLQPPHSGLLNYQVWQWPISPIDLCNAFGETLRKLNISQNLSTPPIQANKPNATQGASFAAFV